MKATCARTRWFTDAKNDERSSRWEKGEERSFARFRGLRMTAKHETSRRGLLRCAVGANVVVEADAQIDERTFEPRRKRLEGAGGADRGSGRGVQRLFAGSTIQTEAFAGKTAIAIDAERNGHDAFVTQVKRFRHHGDPVLFQLGEKPIDITIKIHALGGSENRDGVPLLRAAPAAATMATTASPATGNCALGSIRAAAGGTPHCILHRFAGRRVI